MRLHITDLVDILRPQMPFAEAVVDALRRRALVLALVLLWSGTTLLHHLHGQELPIGHHVVTTFAGREPVLTGRADIVPLYHPTGITSDSQGNVYFVDSVGLRKLSGDGQLTTIAKDIPGGYDLKRANNGEFYFVDGDCCAYKVTGCG